MIPLQRQVDEAKKQYPDNFKALDNNHITVKFTKNAANEIVYQIVIPNNYPQSPPVISCNKAPVLIPITQNWFPVFQIKDVVEELCKFVAANFPVEKVFNERDTHGIELLLGKNPKMIETPQQRRDLLSKSPPTKQVFDNMARIDASIRSNQEKINLSNQSIFQKRQMYGAKLSICEDMGNINEPGLNTEELIQELLGQENLYKSRIEALRDLFAAKQKDHKDYFKEFQELKKQQFKARALINRLKEMA